MTDYCECGNPAIVRVGEDRVPVCPDHFQAWLKDVRSRLDGIVRLVPVGGDS